MSLNRASLVMLCAAFAGIAVAADADGPPRFAICSSNLDKAALGHSESMAQPHLVNVLLDGAGKAQLKEFTAAHLGTTVEVVVGTITIEHVPVQVVVDSGRMQFGFEARAEAEKVLARITEAPPEPCGSLSNK